MKLNGKIEIDGSYKLENLIPACAQWGLNNNISIIQIKRFIMTVK